ncbi:hypothetical protein EII19_05180 [Comamonadaceae bacterium OH2310_COT-174]|nr:hypothetical protein EII19_05180 [Comamonadaceae bacterium OH2310_COT-174]
MRRCFRSTIHSCSVENAGKVFNLAHVFALHLRLLPRKTASQTQSQHLPAPHKTPAPGAGRCS